MSLRRLLEWPGSASVGRILTAGLVSICLVGLGIEAAPESRDSTPLVPPDFRTAFALPVPDGTEVVVRSIEPQRWRSLLVLDLDPEDPPEWTDTVLIAVFDRFPACSSGRRWSAAIFGRGAGAGWWSFGNRLGVRTSSHTSVIEAVQAARMNTRSENPSGPGGAAGATPTSKPSLDGESPISTPVGPSGNR